VKIQTWPSSCAIAASSSSLRQLVDEVLFDTQQKAGAGVGEFDGHHQRILRYHGHGDLVGHRQLRHERVDDLLNALLILWVGNDALRPGGACHGDVTWEQQQKQTERQNAPSSTTQMHHRSTLIPLPVLATHGEVRRVSDLVLLGGPGGKVP
jgi:hypothetical protein